MILVSRGLIFDVTRRPGGERVAFFDSLLPLSDGSWLSGCTVGARKHDVQGTIRICRSSDGGQSWCELPCRFDSVIDGRHGSLTGAEFVEVEPGKLLLFTTWFDRSEPDRPLFDPVSEGLLHEKLLMAESHDAGDTWGAWRTISTPELTGCAMTGPPLQWSDGTIAFAFESYKHYDDPTPAAHGAWLLVSRDNGQTFERPFLVAMDPSHQVFYWDQRLCVTDTPGEFVGFFWTHDRAAQCDLPVHFVRGSIESGSAVTDRPRDTGIPGQIAAPLWLDSDRLLTFVVDRDRPGTMTLWRSGDGGNTWPREDALVVHTHDERANVTQGKEGVDFKQYWEDMAKWSFGHPSARQLDERQVLLTFYAGGPDSMSIHWARVAVD